MKKMTEKEEIRLINQMFPAMGKSYSRSAGDIKDGQVLNLAVSKDTTNELHNQIIQKEKECKTLKKGSKEYNACVDRYNELIRYNNRLYQNQLDYMKRY